MKFRYGLLSLIMAPMAVWLTGCADVPSTGPEPPDLTAEYRFLNAAPDLQNVAVTVDDEAVGSVAYKETIDYQTYPAGGRQVLLTANTTDTLQLTMTTKRKGTIVFLPKTDTFRDYLKIDDVRVFDSETLEDGDFTFSVIDTAGENVGDSVMTVSKGTVKIADAASFDTLNVTFKANAPYATFGAGQILQVDSLDNEMLMKDVDEAGIPTGDYTITVYNKDLSQVLTQKSMTISNKRYIFVITGPDATQVDVVMLE